MGEMQTCLKTRSFPAVDWQNSSQTAQACRGLVEVCEQIEADQRPCIEHIHGSLTKLHDACTGATTEAQWTWREGLQRISDPQHHKSEQCRAAEPAKGLAHCKTRV